MKLLATLLMVSMTLSGCMTRLPFTATDKIDSMAAHRETKFNAQYEESHTAPGGDSTIRSLKLTSGPHGYTQMLTAIVIGADQISANKVAATIERKTDVSDQPGSISSSEQLSIDLAELVGLQLGQAAIVSNDGYFLTAGHVVDAEESRLVFFVFDLGTNQREAVVLPFRTVFVDTRSDFAIIKAEINSPFHFRLRETPFERGETLFGGAWMDGVVSSGQLRWKSRSRFSKQAGADIDQWSTSVPLVPGDSGSAFFDTNGHLLGIATRVQREISLVSVTKTSIFSTMNHEKIAELIEADRKAALPQ